ncbi:glycosyltransferase [Chromohalobacter sp.]|uniref:glycosyltransferase family protein n=1 Tax=Chromohalobacter sp. TaxID=50740 RepID=UPI001DFF256C|nr:glycosyltransferase [Chromohalobacter sp.]NQY44357.1 glycosyltransferase [Chromohalobacter sp.]
MIYRPRDVFPEKKSFSPDFVFQKDGVSFFYTYIRKNASTSFKRLFQLMHPGLCPGKTPSLSCMAQHAQVKDLSPEEIEKSYANRVFIYRDPVERVFSVYKNKLIQQDGAEDLLEKLSKVTGRDPGLMTFDDFVNDYVTLLETERWSEVDGHLYPQAWHLLPITYNMVIPMENVHEEMSKIIPKELCDKVFLEPSNSTNKGSRPLESCDVDTPAVYFQKKYIQEKVLPEINKVLTPEAEKRLKEIYREDYAIIADKSGGDEVEVFGESSFQRKDNYSRLVVKLSSVISENRLLKTELSDFKERFSEKESELERRICELKSNLEASGSSIEKLRIDHDELFSKYQESEAERINVASRYNEVFAKYKDANAKYRSISQQLSLLKNSKAYKVGSYIKDASKSWKGAVKLPIRLWRLRAGNRRKTGLRTQLRERLRYIKWNFFVPFAVRVGIPHHRVASLALPKKIDKYLGQSKEALASSNSNIAANAKPGVSFNKAYFSPPSAAAQEISILGWPAPPDNGKPLVLAVMDEFTEGCFGSDLRLLQPRPDNWYGLAKKYSPSLVFIESAWKGNGGSWQYRVGSYNNKPGQELDQIASWARQENIPSVFWNKEDPVHHDKFMEAAGLADHIFTTDQNMVESYKKRTGRQSVHALPFAAQPTLHKPAPLRGRLKKSCFAGSWYGNRHAERGEAMKWLLASANKFGLDIFDRNHGTGIFPFPEEYQGGIRGSLPYLELCKEYPRYRVFLNVNSVTDSPTMFSRRVFELMACGTPVVSTYARGIEELFESDAVWLVNSEEEAEEAIHTLLNDDAEWRRRSLAGIREVFSSHTYAHRLNSVFEAIGSDERIETMPKLLLVASVETPAEIDQLLSFAEGQHYRNFQLLIKTSDASSGYEGAIPENVELVASEQLAKGVQQCESNGYQAVGRVSTSHSYGTYFLQDLVNAMSYQPEADGWAKACNEDAFAYDVETRLCAAIWQPKAFKPEWLNSEDLSLSSNSLFCTDTDEFSANCTQRKDRDLQDA